MKSNIHFMPSYSAIQGAEMMLQNKRGNVMDNMMFSMSRKCPNCGKAISFLSFMQ